MVAAILLLSAIQCFTVHYGSAGNEAFMLVHRRIRWTFLPPTGLECKALDSRQENNGNCYDFTTICLNIEIFYTKTDLAWVFYSTLNKNWIHQTGYSLNYLLFSQQMKVIWLWNWWWDNDSELLFLSKLFWVRCGLILTLHVML